MIDFTKIQTIPVPPPITTLQKANASLTTENKAFKTAIYISAGIVAGYLIFKMYKKKKEDEASEKSQSPRD
jgi:hypothetical protein